MTSSHRNSTAAPKPPINKEEGSRKLPPPPLSKPQEPALRCPRCDSPNTKFCYYNNYSLSQPRHFCKSCRRYWTRGGALRNVPVGGGCRKNKRVIKSSSSSSSSTTPIFSALSDNIGGGFKLFHGELGGFRLNRAMNPSHGGSVYNNIPAVSCFGPENVAVSSLISSGGISSSTVPENNTDVGLSVSLDTNLASSIESLSSLNQDLHRKLQQQRLAMLLGNSPVIETLQLRPFQNFEIIQSSMAPPPRENVVDGGSCSRREYSVDDGTGAGEISPATDRFFGNSNFSHSSSSLARASMAAAAAAAAASGSGVNNGNADGNMGNWHGLQAWSDLHHHHPYNNALP